MSFSKKKILSEEKIDEEKDKNKKYSRKNGGVNLMSQRKSGQIVQLPFRQHAITKI